MKNRFIKGIAVALAAVMTCGMMTGCGSSKAVSTETENGNEVLFSYDGEDVTLKEAWIYGKNTAKQYEAYYASYFGDNFWSMSMGTNEDGEAIDFEDYVKEQVVDSIKQIIVLDHKAADYDLSLSEDEIAECEKFAKAYAEDATGKSILEECGAKEEDVLEIYKDNMLASKVKDEMIKDTDTNVSDDEARKSKIYRVTFSITTTDADENTVDMTDEEKAKVKKEAETALADIKAGKKTIEDVATEKEFTNTDETFAAGESSEGEAFEKAMAAVKDGEMIDGVFETANGYVIAKLVAYTDADATAENKESIIAERQQEAFSGLYSVWTEELEAEWSYKDDVNQTIWADFKLGAEVEATTEVMEETAPAAEATTEQ